MRDALHKWLPDFPRTQVEGLNLLAFPYAGAQPNVFKSWASIATFYGMNLCSVALPGRGSRFNEKPHEDLTRLVCSFLSDAGQLCFQRPYAIFGHSLGAAIAFELTHQIVALGYCPPVALFLSGRAAPGFSETRSLSNLPEEQLKAELREMGGTPLEVLENPEIMNLLLPVIRADFKMAEDMSAVTKPPLHVPIHCFSGEDDEYCSPEKMENWRHYAGREFHLTSFPGGHFFIDDFAKEIMHCIANDLQRMVNAA